MNTMSLTRELECLNKTLVASSTCGVKPWVVFIGDGVIHDKLHTKVSRQEKTVFCILMSEIPQLWSLLDQQMPIIEKAVEDRATAHNATEENSESLHNNISVAEAKLMKLTEALYLDLKTLGLVNLARFVLNVFSSKACAQTDVYIECCHSASQELLQACWKLIVPMRNNGANVLFSDHALTFANSFFECAEMACRVTALYPDVSGCSTMEFDSETLATKVPNDAMAALGKYIQTGGVLQGKASINANHGTYRMVLHPTEENELFRIMAVVKTGPSSDWVDIDPKTGEWYTIDMDGSVNVDKTNITTMTKTGAPAIVTISEHGAGTVILFMFHFEDLIHVPDIVTMHDLIQVYHALENDEQKLESARQSMSLMDEHTLHYYVRKVLHENAQRTQTPITLPNICVSRPVPIYSELKIKRPAPISPSTPRPSEQTHKSTTKLYVPPGKRAVIKTF